MKKYILILFGLIIFNSCMCQNYPIDSIYFIGYNNNPTFTFCQDRKRTLDRFCDYLNDKENIKNIVDTMITDSNEIQKFIIELSDLKVKKKMHFSSNQILMDAKFSLQKKQIRLIPSQELSLDNRMLLLLFSKQGIDYVWIDRFYLDRGYKRYVLSQPMRQHISQYSHVFDDFLNNQ